MGMVTLNVDKIAQNGVGTRTVPVTFPLGQTGLADWRSVEDLCSM